MPSPLTRSGAGAPRAPRTRRSAADAIPVTVFDVHLTITVRGARASGVDDLDVEEIFTNLIDEHIDEERAIGGGRGALRGRSVMTITDAVSIDVRVVGKADP